jgi:hypothetical protein
MRNKCLFFKLPSLWYFVKRTNKAIKSKLGEENGKAMKRAWDGEMVLGLIG